ncbi:WXG100 family type VII secretion target [Paenibacillus sp. NPDC055715]
MSRISVSLGDLRRAVQQCGQLKQRLQLQEQQMRNIYDRLHEWRGESATELTRKMEAFLQGTTVRMQELDEHKEQLKRYIHEMEENDHREKCKWESQW